MARLSGSLRSLVVFGSLVGLLLVAGTTRSPAATAQATTLELVAQSSWVDPGGIFGLQVRATAADSASTIAVEVYPPYPSRAAFAVADLTDQDPLLRIGPQALADLQTTSNEVLSWEIAVAGPNTEPPTEPDAPPVLRTDGESAVYPLQVTLFDADGLPVDQIRTSLIELERTRAGTPLRVVLVLGADLPLGTGPDGAPLLPDDAAAPLTPIIEALELHPEAPALLTITPESLAALARGTPDQQALVERLAAVLESTEVLAAPYVDVDEQAWVDAELESELGELIDAGLETVRVITGSEPIDTVAILDPSIAPSGLEWLRSTGVQGVLVGARQVEALDAELVAGGIARRFLVPTGAATVPALQVDTSLTGHFVAGRGSVLDANRLLADLTLLALEDPDARRAAVIAAPSDWTADVKFLNVVLSGMERIPAIRLTTIDDALANTEFLPASGVDTISPPLRRALQPVPPPPLGSYRTDRNQAASAIDSWRSVVATAPEATELMSELLLVSADDELSSGQRSAYIDTVYDLINEQKEGAIATADADTITLTGRNATVPIVVENRLDVSVSVLLVLDSVKLDFPDGREVLLTLEPGSNRVEIPIEARASGDSPIRIQVLSPDRSILLGSSEVLVRTFAFSGVGVVIAVVAVVVLVWWWLRHRRASRDTLPPSTTPPSVSTPTRTGATSP